MSKQLYASLEITDKSVNVLVSEWYNLRFYILQSVSIPCDGVKNFRVVDEAKLINAISFCKDEIRKKVGASLVKVILVIPPIGFKRVAIETSINLDGNPFTSDDVLKALNKTLDVDISNDLLAVNRIPVSYTINGITSKRMPINETGEQASINVDLLCADKSIVFDYVNVVEKSGLQVLDICLSNYAICKEGSYLEQSTNKNIILLDINDNHSFISLIAKGKIMSCELINSGIENFNEGIKEKYNISYSAISKHIKYLASENVESDSVVYIYQKDGVTNTISEGQLNSLVIPYVEKYVDEIKDMSDPIIKSKETVFNLVSDGSDMVLIADILKRKTECEIKIARPDSVGVRDSRLIRMFGSFFVVKSESELSLKDICCLNEHEYRNIVNKKSFDEEVDSIVVRIKKLFEK